MYRNYILWGSGGHAKVLADIILAQGSRLTALFDNKNVKKALPDIPMYIGIDGFEKWISSQADLSNFAGLAAIGGNKGRDRLKIHALFRERGIFVPTLVHTSAIVSPNVHIGSGTQILALANIASDAYVGESCIINHRASVDHECNLGHGVHLAPGATLCGCVNIGDNVLVGAGAIILPRITISSNAIIGAGAIVTSDVPTGTTFIGNPAKQLKNKRD